MSKIIHQHTIIYAKVKKLPSEVTCQGITDFLNQLVDSIGMKKIFDPIAIDGKFGFTGMVGIVTSHIAFHYFDSDQSLQFDVYSCKEYDLNKLMVFLDSYWKFETADILVTNRERGLSTKKFIFQNARIEPND
ncbi:MAG: S-adenosylmethionine decarboxylase [Candidatus Zixiibacteriota bacterium]